MVIYFDMCCLKRPFDDQTHLRIGLETTAIVALVHEVDDGRLQAVRSLAHEMENSQNTDRDRASSVAAWLDSLNPLEPQPQAVAQRALALRQAGFRLMDALHIAWAEHLLAHVLVTVDERPHLPGEPDSGYNGKSEGSHRTRQRVGHMNAITNPVELRRRGLEVLVRELGYANAMRFLLQYDTGRGDYTKERAELLPDWKVEEMMREPEKFLRNAEPRR